MADFDERVAEARARWMDILDGAQCRETRKKTLLPLVDNVSWMEVKLEDARELVAESNVAIPYDNGGGQAGIRENPVMKGYESLYKSYMSGVSQILAVIPPEEAGKVETADKPATVLQLVQAKHRREEA